MANLNELITPCLANLLLLAAAFGLGRRWLRFLRLASPAVPFAALSALAGYGVLGVILHFYGLWKFTSLSVGVFLIAVVIVFSRDVAGTFGDFRALTRSAWLERRDFAWLLPGAAVFAVVLIAAFARPVGDYGSDGVAYHLLSGSIWKTDGRIHVIPYFFGLGYPQLCETLQGALMVLSNDRAPGILSFIFLILLTSQLWGFARRFGAPKWAAAAGVSLLAAMPAVVNTVEQSFVDVPFAAFALAGASLAFENGSAASIFMAGLFCGFAYGVKYTGLFVIAATLVAALFAWRNSKGARTVAYAAGALGATLPWIIRNVVYYGFPIYPPPLFFMKYFPVRYVSAPDVAAFSDYVIHRDDGARHGLLGLLLLPFNFTFQTNLFSGAGGIGLVPLSLAPLGAYLLIKNNTSKAWFVWAALLTIAWYLTLTEARYLDHVVVLSLAFAIVALPSIARQKSRWGRGILWAVVEVSFAYGAGYGVKIRINAIHSVFSPKYALQYRRDNVPYLGAMNFLDDNPEVKKVLILNNLVTPFYLNKPFVMIRGPYNEKPYEKISDPMDGVKDPALFGVTHILDVVMPAKSRGFEIVPGKTPGTEKLKLVFEEPTARIYEVRAK